MFSQVPWPRTNAPALEVPATVKTQGVVAGWLEELWGPIKVK